MSDLVLGIRITADGKQYIETVNTAIGANDKLGQSLSRAASETGKLSQQQGNSLSLHEKQVLAVERLAAAEAKMNASNAASAASEATLAGVIRSNRTAVGSLTEALGLNAKQQALVRASQKESRDSLALLVGNINAAQKGNVAMAASGAGAAAGFRVISAGALASAFSTDEARRSLIALAREATRGNFSLMPGTFITLASRANLSGAAILSVLGPIGAVTAATLVAAKAFFAGAAEMREMNNALALTSGFAGLTRGTMRELAQSVSDAGTLTIGASKAIVTQLVASGRIGAQSIGAVAKLAEDFAAATGRDVDKIAPELAKFFEDPAKGAAELNKQMHSLEPAFLEHLRHLTAIGQVEEARLALAEKVGAQLPKQGEQLGALAKAWNAVQKAAGSAWDAILGVGRDQTPEQRLAAAQKDLENLRDRLGVTRGSRFDSATAAVLTAQDAVNRSREEADRRRAAAELTDRRNAAAALVGQTSEYQRITELREKIAKLGNQESIAGLDAVAVARARVVLEQQIEGLKISIGAKSQALTEGRIAGDLTIRELEIKIEQNRIDALLTLGRITEVEAIKRRNDLELEKNTEAQFANDRRTFNGLQNADRQQELSIKSAILVKDREAIEAAGKLAAEVAQHNALLKEQEAIRASFLAAATADEAAQDRRNEQIRGFNSTYSELVGQIRLETELIGKTRAERELITAQKKIENDFIKASANLSGKELEKLTQIRDNRLAEITDASRIRDTRQGLQDQLVANAEEQKRLNEDISRGLIDSVFRGFEAGKDIGKNFWDSMANLAKTTVLTPTIKFIVSPITGAITAAIGTPSLGNAATGGGSGLLGAATGFLPKNLFGGAAQTIADFGNFFGSIGSITEAGTTFSVLDAISGFAAANPITAAIAGVGALGSLVPAVGNVLSKIPIIGGLFGGGKSPAVGTGFQVTGQANAQTGLEGTFFALASNGKQNFADVASDQAGPRGQFNALLAQASSEVQKTARVLGIDPSVLAGQKFSVNATRGVGDVAGTLQTAVLQVTDQMAEKLIPTIKSLQQANESLTQTFLRLGTAARAAVVPDVLGRLGLAFNLADQLTGIRRSDLNPFPLTSAQLLAEFQGEFSDRLSRARGGDLNSFGAVGASAQRLLEQARVEFASSQQFVDIFRDVESRTSDLVETTVSEQSIRFADMGLTLREIADNTKNLDHRIADALQKAIDAWQAAQIATQKAAANQITTAVKQTTDAVRRAPVETALVMESAESADFIDAPIEDVGD